MLTPYALTNGEVSGFFIMPEPSRAEPSRAEPSRAEPSRAEPSRAELVPAPARRLTPEAALKVANRSIRPTT